MIMAPGPLTDQVRSEKTDDTPDASSNGTWMNAGRGLVLTTPVLPITILVYVLLAVATSGFLSLANFQNLLASMAVLAIAAIGTTIVFLVAGIDLSVGSTVALSSVVGAIVIRDTGSMLLGLVAAVVVGLAIGAFNGGCVGYAGLPPFVLTLGVLLTARAVAYMAAAAAAGGGGTAASVGQLPPQVLAFGQSTLLAVPAVFWIAFLLVAAFALILSRTVTGRSFFLVGANQLAASFTGIDTKRIKFLAYLIAGGLAGFAGFILTSRLGSGNATAGDALLLEIIAATVIGGTSLFGGLGGVWRTLIGAFLITGLTNALGLQGIAYWYQQIIVGLVVVFGSALAIYLQRFRGRRR
jgi:ribose/xylose/arabinose/galactoside ABC-type transport system permease subunit